MIGVQTELQVADNTGAKRIECIKVLGGSKKQSVQQIVDTIFKIKKKTKIFILAPIIRGKKGQHKTIISQVQKKGFLRIRVDGKVYKVDDDINLDKNKKHTIEILVDRIIIEKDMHERITESVELALELGKGLIVVHELSGVDHIFSENFACPKCEVSLEELTPRMFSFNSRLYSSRK